VLDLGPSVHDALYLRRLADETRRAYAHLTLIASQEAVGHVAARSVKDQMNAFFRRRRRRVALAALVLLAVVGTPVAARLMNAAGDPPRGVLVVIAYRRAGGLTAADRQRIARTARRAEASLPLVGRPDVAFPPGSPRNPVSRDRDDAYAFLGLPDKPTKLPHWRHELRQIAGSGGHGLSVHVTGTPGSSSQIHKAAGSEDMMLLAGSVLIVLVLLGLACRSPLSFSPAAPNDATPEDRRRRALEEWRVEAEAVERAYRAWKAAELPDRHGRHLAYLAAVRREEWAALQLESCTPRARSARSRPTLAGALGRRANG
jgi:hypothetical protein